MAVIGNTRKQNSLLKGCTALLLSGLLIVLIFGTCLGASQETFASPDEAVKALVGALKAVDAKALSAVFGPGSKDLVSSGDPIADKTDYERFINLFEQKSKLEEADANKVVLYVGNEGWPFAIPIVKKDGAWRFDTDEGREEILARRIGRNELSVIQTCLAYVDAQREYALKNRDRDGLPAYAQKFMSDSGKKDGLYWEAKEGDAQSPLGPLVAVAQERGYTGRQSGNKPVPWYGSSGIMTFTVNHDGVVYQEDLGENTKKAALAMERFNPDNTWEKVEEDLFTPK